MQNAPFYYSCLNETQPIKDISDPSGGTVAAMPATVRIHAVHVADGERACDYTRKPEVVAEQDRDWFDVQPDDVRCEACDKATHGNQ